MKEASVTVDDILSLARVTVDEMSSLASVPVDEMSSLPELPVNCWTMVLKFSGVAWRIWTLVTFFREAGKYLSSTGSFFDFVSLLIFGDSGCCSMILFVAVKDQNRSTPGQLDSSSPGT